MNMSAAVDNLLNTLGAIKGVDVLTNGQEPGRRKVFIYYTTGNLERDGFYGRDKYKQEMELTVNFHSDMADPHKSSAKMLQISQVITDDRRRGGQAQTTTNPVFSKTEDNGREGIVYSLTFEIHTDESAFKET